MNQLIEWFLTDTPEMMAVDMMAFMIFWASLCEFIQVFIRGAKGC